MYGDKHVNREIRVRTQNAIRTVQNVNPPAYTTTSGVSGDCARWVIGFFAFCLFLFLFLATALDWNVVSLGLTH